MSNSDTGVCDSIVTSDAPEATWAATSLFGVEQPVDRLQPEVRHPDEVGVGESEGDAEPSTVRFPYVPHFLRQKVAGALALLPVFHAEFEPGPSAAPESIQSGRDQMAAECRE